MPLLLNFSQKYICIDTEKVKAKSLSHFRLFGTPWAVAYQAPQSMGFSRQAYWPGFAISFQGIFPTQGSNLGIPSCRWTLLASEPPGKSLVVSISKGFPGGSLVKNLPANRRHWFDPCIRKIPWQRKSQPTLSCQGNLMDKGA